MSELGYYRHVHYTLALMCAKNRIIIFCSLLDIWENVLLDIRKNVEWPHFFWPTLYCELRHRYRITHTSLT